MEKNKTPRRDLLNEMGFENSIVFENPDYDSAIIGYDADNYRVVYDYEKMIEHLMDIDGMEYDEAVEFIEYNTIRSLPYAGSNSPIVLHKFDEYLFENNEIPKFNPEDFVNKCITLTCQYA
jgi:hypothetical protein